MFSFAAAPATALAPLSLSVSAVSSSPSSGFGKVGMLVERGATSSVEAVVSPLDEKKTRDLDIFFTSFWRGVGDLVLRTRREF